MLPADPKPSENEKPRRPGIVNRLWTFSAVSGTTRGPLARYGGMGMELGASIIGLTLLGLWVDHHFGTSPVWVLIGAGLGVVGGLYNFIRAALRLSRLPSSRGTGSDTDEDHGNHERR